MASGEAEVSIARRPDDVWKVIREFGGLADYMPGVESCTVDGDVRTLEAADAPAVVVSYELLAGGAALEAHKGSPVVASVMPRLGPLVAEGSFRRLTPAVGTGLPG